jgi:putative membrane protein
LQTSPNQVANETKDEVKDESLTSTSNMRQPAVAKKRTIKAWITPFSRVHRMPVFKRIWFYLACMALYTVVAHFVVSKSVTAALLKEAVSIGCANLILGLLLVFRTNSAYERWSEGRRLWGQLMNESRSLSLKVSHYLKIPDQEKDQFGELIVSYAFALKHHLRDSTPSNDLPGIKPMAELGTAHLPVHVTDTMYAIMNGWYQKNFIDSIILVSLSHHLSAFMDIVGACERIRSTPLAMSYRAFIRQGIALNLLILPLYSASALPLVLSVPISVVASYFLIGLELIAEEIEDPFGVDADDLPLDIICERICTTVHEIFQKKASLVSPPSEVLKFTGAFSPPKPNPLV